MNVDLDALRRMSEKMSAAVPQAAILGLRVVAIEPGLARMDVPWREDLVGDPETGVIAGGVVTTLLDQVCGLAIRSVRRGVAPATLDLRIDYMRPATPTAGVVAEAHCYRLTHTIAFVRGQAWDADPSDLIATAQAAFVVSA